MFAGIGRCRRFRVASNPKVSETPVTLIQQYVFWLEVTMDHLRLEGGESLGHVGQDYHGLVKVEPSSGFLKMLAE
jgi:hypothetical protein